eukprot:403389_1
MGVNINAFSPAVSGNKQFSKFRTQIRKSKSINEIDKILKSRNDFTLCVYTIAIKNAGILGNVSYCTKIANVALDRIKLIPTDARIFYSVLFNAFNQNSVPLQSDPFFKHMINIHKITPNAIILNTLLNGCTQKGNVNRAIKIWQMFKKYKLTPDEGAYIVMIKTCGHNGQATLAKQYYDEMINNGIKHNFKTKGAMLHAFIKSDQINEALKMKTEMELNNDKLTITTYIPLISYYLRDSKTQNAYEALRLLKECIDVNKIEKLNDILLNMKHVAVLKAMQNSKDILEREQYFKIIKNGSNERLNNGLKEWDYETASIIFGGYMEYYGTDYKCKESVECFEKLCTLNVFGYWYCDKKINNKWMIDLHGYSYEQIEFILGYLINIKYKQLIDKMSYEWIFICGKRQSNAPNSKETKSGIKQFVINKLWELFNIGTCDVKDNPGRVLLNETHIKEYLNGNRDNELNIALKSINL